MKVEIITYNDDNIEKYRDVKYYCSECGFEVLRDDLLRPYVRYELKSRPLGSNSIYGNYRNEFCDVGEIRGRACQSCVNQMKNKEYKK